MAVRRVTKAVVDRLPISGVVWDADVRGFGVRRQQRDAPLICFEGASRHPATVPHNRSSRAPWTPETARREARKLLGEIAAGRDPADARAARKHSSTFSEFAERYCVGACCRQQKTPFRNGRSAQSSAPYLPAFGRQLIPEITSADLAKFQASKSATPVAANRCLALMSHMFNIGGAVGLAPSPLQSVRTRRQVSGARAGTNAFARGVGSSGSALATASAGPPSGFSLKRPPFRREFPEDWRAIAVVKLLIFTGARLSEVLGLR